MALLLAALGLGTALTRSSAAGTDSTPADGRVGDRVVTPFDHEPAVDRLDPQLRAALQDAAVAARRDGVELRITSGWRSAAYQQELLDAAVLRYGSSAEARRWVSTPDRSAHVQGEAVDVAPRSAAHWLELHGASVGLCRVYANEVWHFERLATPGGTCPALRPDASS